MRKQILFLLFFMFSFSAQAAITTAAPPNGTLGTAYSHQIITNSASPLYDWEITGLPAGISFTEQGANNVTLTGTPTTAGTYQVTVTVREFLPPNAVLDGPIDYTIVIAAPAVTASVPTLSEWGMIFLSLLIAMFGIAKVRRRN